MAHDRIAAFLGDDFGEHGGKPGVILHQQTGEALISRRFWARVHKGKEGWIAMVQLRRFIGSLHLPLHMHWERVPGTFGANAGSSLRGKGSWEAHAEEGKPARPGVGGQTDDAVVGEQSAGPGLPKRWVQL